MPALAWRRRGAELRRPNGPPRSASASGHGEDSEPQEKAHDQSRGKALHGKPAQVPPDAMIEHGGGAASIPHDEPLEQSPTSRRRPDGNGALQSGLRVGTIMAKSWQPHARARGMARLKAVQARDSETCAIVSRL